MMYDYLLYSPKPVEVFQDYVPQAHSENGSLYLIRFTESELEEFDFDVFKVLAAADYDGVNSTSGQRRTQLESVDKLLELYQSVWPTKGEEDRPFWFGDYA